MKKKLFILLIFLALSIETFAQKLTSFTYSSCDKGNPHKYLLNSMVNNIGFHGDSLTIKITWVDNCAFEPEFHLTKIETDTLYFKYNNKREEESTTCSCAFELEFKIIKAIHSDYQIKINETKLDKSTKRYKAENYIVEYFPERTTNQKVYREIYSERGKIIVEVFYDKNGRILSEKYYNNWGFLERERKY